MKSSDGCKMMILIEDDDEEDEFDFLKLVDFEDIDDVILFVEFDEDDEEGFINFKDGIFGGLGFDDDDVDGEDGEEVLVELIYRMMFGEFLDEVRVMFILVEGDFDVEIIGIQYDFCFVIFGDLFVCVKGFKFDGYEFVN